MQYAVRAFEPLRSAPLMLGEAFCPTAWSVQRIAYLEPPEDPDPVHRLRLPMNAPITGVACCTSCPYQKPIRDHAARRS